MSVMKLEAPQAIRTIFFDAGFTLLRTSPSLAEICQDVCQREGVPADLEQISRQLPEAEAYFSEAIKANRRTWASEASITLFWNGYYKALLRPFIAAENEALLERCAQEIIREFDQHTRWELFPDVLPTLQALQGRGFTLGIISDWGVNLASIISGLDLPRYFDCLIVSAVSRYAKPEPGLYELALQRAGAIPDYAIHIGDSYIHDVLGARAVGITPILIDRPGKLRTDEVDCLLIRDLREVLDLLEIALAPESIAAWQERREMNT
ncbi:MAG TPA: HAD-IA family hydrolase [Ktedonobacterales bacterium]|nr:HAD-IA family hydrolase [Ktedonobacterales bacterium]